MGIEKEMLATAKDLVEVLAILGPWAVAVVLWFQVKDLNKQCDRYRKFLFSLGAKSSGIEFKED